jgi:hypothetical protein
MRGKPLKKAKEAARSFVENMNLEYSEVGLIVFSDAVKTSLHASQDETKILKAIKNIECCETGCCNDADPFEEIFNIFSSKEIGIANKISALLRKNDNNNKNFAVILADGVWSYQDEAINKARECHQNDINIVAIGFGGADREFLKAIASTDEGSIFTTTEGLVKTFSTIAQEIGFTEKR